MRYLVLLFLFSCSTFDQPRTPQQRHQDRVNKCVHKFLDKGVNFKEASKECADRIFKKDVV